MAAKKVSPEYFADREGFRVSLRRLGHRLRDSFRSPLPQNPPNAIQQLQMLHPSPLPTSALASRHTVDTSKSPQPPETENEVAKAVISTSTWAGLGTSLKALEQGLGLFPPLKSAVSGLLSILDIFQAAAKSREDYNELASDLTTIVDDLTNHLVQSKSIQMSESISRVVVGLEKQIKYIHERQQRWGSRNFAQAADDIDDLVACYRHVDMLFRQLQNNMILSTWSVANEQLANTRLEGMYPAKQAWYDAGGSTLLRRRGCTPNTRQTILRELQNWAHDHDGPKVYWMNGMAGTGKTTIAYSFCVGLEGTHQLAASFFCSRTLPDCRDATRIIPTIAYQLARFSHPFRACLCQILGKDPDISTRGVTTQFQRLVNEPLLEVKSAIPAGLVVVIDALDECSDRSDAQAILELLFYYSKALPIKFFVTCRPEPGILGKLLSRDEQTRSVLHLHDIENSLVQKDIETYLQSELASTSASEEEIRLLAEQSGKLFIYAATVVRYIRPENTSVDLRRRLSIVLGSSPSSASKAYKQVDTLYNTILASALEHEDLETWEADNIKQLLHTVICSKEPLTTDTLASLLNLDGSPQVRSSLEPLRSVLHISEGDELVSVLHASFPEYMLSRERSTRFFCNRAYHEEVLGERCLHIMKDSLRFNICDLESSLVLDSDVPDLSDRVSKAVTPHLFYACKYWCDHLEYAGNTDRFVSYLDRFLSHQLLFWMEVFNLKGCLSKGVSILLQAHAWLQSSKASASLCTLAQDAQMFLTFFCANPVSQSTPHIYISALAFWPKASPVWLRYGKNASGLPDTQGPEIIGRQLGALSVWTDESRIECVSVSPGGSRVASGSRACTIFVRDTQSGAIIAGPFEGHSDHVNSVSFSPDGERIVSGSHDSTIRIWDVQTGNTVVGPLIGHTASVTSVAFSSDGSRVVSGSRDRTVLIWDARSGSVIAGPFERHADIVTSVAFSSDGSRVISGSRDNTLFVLDAQNGAVVSGPFIGHVSQVNSVAFSPRGDHIASGSEDRTICIWDAKSAAIVAGPFRGHTGPVNSVAFSPDGAYLTSGCQDGAVFVWNARNGAIVAGPFEGHTNQVSSVAFCPNGLHIVSGSWDRTIRIWELHNEGIASSSYEGHAGLVKSVVFSPDGAYVASGGNDGGVHIWNAQDGTRVAGPFEGHTDSVNSVAFSPDGGRVASASYDGTVRLWDVRTGGVINRPFTGHGACVTCVAFSPNGARLASGSQDCTIRIWDAHSGDIVAGPFDEHTGIVTSVAFSLDGGRVASGSWDGTIRIWDLDGSHVIAELPKSPTNIVSSVAFSPNGARIVSGSWDRTIYVWDAHNGGIIAGPFVGHTDCINSVAFSNNGSAIVSGSWDNTVRIWDAESGEPLVEPFEGHTNWVSSVAFSPDDARVVSGSGDHAIRVWELKPNPPKDGAIWDNWSLNKDGWVVGSASQILLWVPPELRAGLKRPQNSVVIHRRGVLELCFDDALLGRRWRECYSG